MQGDGGSRQPEDVDILEAKATTALEKLPETEDVIVEVDSLQLSRGSSLVSQVTFRDSETDRKHACKARRNLRDAFNSVELYLADVFRSHSDSTLDFKMFQTLVKEQNGNKLPEPDEMTWLLRLVGKKVEGPFSFGDVLVMIRAWYSYRNMPEEACSRIDHQVEPPPPSIKQRPAGRTASRDRSATHNKNLHSNTVHLDGTLAREALHNFLCEGLNHGKLVTEIETDHVLFSAGEEAMVTKEMSVDQLKMAVAPWYINVSRMKSSKTERVRQATKNLQLEGWARCDCFTAILTFLAFVAFFLQSAIIFMGAQLRVSADKYSEDPKELSDKDVSCLSDVANMILIAGCLGWVSFWVYHIGQMHMHVNHKTTLQSKFYLRQYIYLYLSGMLVMAEVLTVLVCISRLKGAPSTECIFEEEDTQSIDRCMYCAILAACSHIGFSLFFLCRVWGGVMSLHSAEAPATPRDQDPPKLPMVSDQPMA